MEEFPAYSLKRDIRTMRENGEICRIYEKDNYPIKSRQKIGDSDVVYLLYNPLNGLYKIGITNSLKDRLSSIIASSGIEEIIFCCGIFMEADYDEPARQVEQWLHSFYKSKRKKGEWFKLTKRDLCDLRLFAFFVGSEQVDGYYNLHCGGFNEVNDYPLNHPDQMVWAVCNGYGNLYD
jgi:hypothetical protein